MPAYRYRLDGILSSAELRQRVAERLAQGQICVCPTETIYGIGGRADSDEVRAKILAAKQRPPENPMILIAASPSAFEGMDLLMPTAAQRLAAAFWPGNLTLVLPCRSRSGTVGIRVSDHPFIQTVAPLVPAPLFSTSANRSGEPYDGSPERLWDLFADSVDFVVDAGELPKSAPSTVVSVAADSSIRVLREGAVGAAAILAALA